MAAGFLDDWTEAYFIAEDRARKEAEAVKFVATSVSRWKNSDKVRNTFEQYRKHFADRDAEQRQKGRR